jgi:Bacterial nucleoid DNA-binding protein
MNKTELIEAVHTELNDEKYNYSKADVKRVVDKAFALMEAAIIDQQPVKINGLVSFKRKVVQAKTYRVPNSDRKVKKPQRIITKAYISKTLAEQSTKVLKKK